MATWWDSTGAASRDEGICIFLVSGAACSILRAAKNTEEVIITESVIDAAALWSAGLRNVIPVYGVTGLTEEIMAHLVECRVKRAVLLLDADEAGRAAAIDMAQRLAAVNIEARSVELPVKDAAEFIAGGGARSSLPTSAILNQRSTLPERGTIQPIKDASLRLIR